MMATDQQRMEAASRVHVAASFGADVDGDHAFRCSMRSQPCGAIVPLRPSSPPPNTQCSAAMARNVVEECHAFLRHNRTTVFARGGTGCGELKSPMRTHGRRCGKAEVADSHDLQMPHHGCLLLVESRRG